MSKFTLNADYYGGYAYIKTDYSGDTHIYKIVNAIQSNYYCDVPIKVNSTPCLHKNIVPVLNVIHCGIDETKVVRVAIDDCENIEFPNSEVIRCKDCKYCEAWDYFEKNCYRCIGKWDISGAICADITLDDYCSYAERKDEE